MGKNSWTLDRDSRGTPVYQLNRMTFLRFIMEWNVEMCSCLFGMPACPFFSPCPLSISIFQFTSPIDFTITLGCKREFDLHFTASDSHKGLQCDVQKWTLCQFVCWCVASPCNCQAEWDHYYACRFREEEVSLCVPYCTSHFWPLLGASCVWWERCLLSRISF